jgi:hypothetical protein
METRPDEATSKPTRSRKVIYVAMRIILVVLVATILAGANADPYERAAADAGQRLLDTPGFKARYNVDDPKDVQRVAGELVTGGLARLDDPSLLQFFQLTGRVLDVADPETCARIFRGTASTEETFAEGRKLDIETFRAYTDMTMTAAILDFGEAPGPAAPTAEEQQAAFVALAAAFGPGELDRVSGVLNDPASGSAVEVCEAGRKIIAAVSQLPEPARSDLLRVLVQSELGG